jgi:hypothetical protein
MAVGTGFGQLFRGIGLYRFSKFSFIYSPFREGQVGGVAISSAIFQSKLDGELFKRIRTPDAEEVSTFLCSTLPKTNSTLFPADQKDQTIGTPRRKFTARSPTDCQRLICRQFKGSICFCCLFYAPRISYSVACMFVVHILIRDPCLLMDSRSIRQT